MEVLDDLDLKGNQILNAYLQGTAKKVSSKLTIRLSDGSGQSSAVEYDGESEKELTITAQSIGSINRAQMFVNSQIKDPEIKEGVLYIPAVYGPQGIQGVQGTKGIQGLSGRLDDARYTNPEPMPAPVGGLPEGTVFDGMEFQELLTKLLYPYTVPIISLESSVNGGVYEFGSEFKSIEFNLNVIKKSEDITRTYIHKSTSGIVKETSDLIKGGTLTHVEPTIKSTVTFQGVTEDKTGSTVKSNSIAYTFVYPVYYGTISGIPTPNDVVNLSKKITTKTSITHILSESISDKRFVIACPPGWEISKILDGNGFDNTAAFTKEVMNIIGLDETAQAYNVYYSSVQSQPAGYKLIYS